MVTAYLSHNEVAQVIAHLLERKEKDEAEALNAQYEYALTTGIGRPAYRMGPAAERYVTRVYPEAIPDLDDTTYRG